MLKHEEIHKEVRVIKKSVIVANVRQKSITESGRSLLNKLIDEFIAAISQIVMILIHMFNKLSNWQVPDHRNAKGNIFWLYYTAFDLYLSRLA